jgi:hypothetical protein
VLRSLRVEEDTHATQSANCAQRHDALEISHQRVTTSRCSVTLPMYPIYSPTTGIYSTLLCLPVNSADVRSYWAVSWRN